ncbi:MAG: HU family DNA-binding protein [Clostridiales bacterium]|nr:HU family DNA-binding protein [Clostridiales bacterium]
MNKAELAAAVAYSTGLTKKDAENAVNAMFELIRSNVCSGEKVQIKGFGAFELKTKRARMARNPVTKEPMVLGETVVPVFKPGERFRAGAAEKGGEKA